MRSHPGPNQVYVILIGGNNMPKTTKPALEVAKLVSRFRRIMAEAQKAKVRVLLCGTIPDPRPAVDSKLKLLEEALKDLEMGQGNNFLSMRAMMLDAQGKVRTDLYKPRGDIHLNASGTKIVSLRIQRMLEIMLPNLVQAPVPAQVQTPAVAKPQRVRIQAPVQATVIVNAPPVVKAPLVAPVNHVPVIVQAPAVASQDQVESMETDEYEILAKLFFKKFGRALPEQEKEKEKDDVDQINMNLIDLTDEPDEMEVATPVPVVVAVKTEPIEAAKAAGINSNANASNVTDKAEALRDRKEVAKARKALIAFGKTLRKTNKIPEKEAPKSIVADSNMSEDVSVNPVTVKSVKPVNTIQTAEQINAETEAEIEANQREFVAEFGDIPLDEFDNTGSGFRLYGPDNAEVTDEDEDMINDV